MSEGVNQVVSAVLRSAFAPMQICCMVVQDLDEAARRRLTKQVYVPLPNAAARLQMFTRQLGKHKLCSGSVLNTSVPSTDSTACTSGTNGTRTEQHVDK